MVNSCSTPPEGTDYLGRSYQYVFMPHSVMMEMVVVIYRARASRFFTYLSLIDYSNEDDCSDHDLAILRSTKFQFLLRIHTTEDKSKRGSTSDLPQHEHLAGCL